MKILVDGLVKEFTAVDKRGDCTEEFLFNFCFPYNEEKEMYTMSSDEYEWCKDYDSKINLIFELQDKLSPEDFAEYRKLSFGCINIGNLDLDLCIDFLKEKLGLSDNSGMEWLSKFDNVVFYNFAHKRLFLKIIRDMGLKYSEPKYEAFVYLVTLNPDHLKLVYDFKEHRINFDFFENFTEENGIILGGNSLFLAFNLLTGRVLHPNESYISIFRGRFRIYYFEAIKLRFPWYFDNNREDYTDKFEPSEADSEISWFSKYDNFVFCGSAHKKAFLKVIRESNLKHPYYYDYEAFVYLITLDPYYRSHIYDIFNFKDDEPCCINSNFFKSNYVNNALFLAFDLGYYYKFPCPYVCTPADIFNSEYARYYFEAIKLCCSRYDYPSDCDDDYDPMN